MTSLKLIGQENLLFNAIAIFCTPPKVDDRSYRLSRLRSPTSAISSVTIVVQEFGTILGGTPTLAHLSFRLWLLVLLSRASTRSQPTVNLCMDQIIHNTRTYINMSVFYLIWNFEIMWKLFELWFCYRIVVGAIFPHAQSHAKRVGGMVNIIYLIYYNNERKYDNGVAVYDGSQNIIIESRRGRSKFMNYT